MGRKYGSIFPSLLGGIALNMCVAFAIASPNSWKETLMLITVWIITACNLGIAITPMDLLDSMMIDDVAQVPSLSSSTRLAFRLLDIAAIGLLFYGGWYIPATMLGATWVVVVIRFDRIRKARKRLQ